MNSDVDIETLPISEWRFSVRHICLRYWNNICQCRMSDITDIEIDVDAHLCSMVTLAIFNTNIWTNSLLFAKLLHFGVWPSDLGRYLWRKNQGLKIRDTILLNVFFLSATSSSQFGAFEQSTDFCRQINEGSSIHPRDSEPCYIVDFSVPSRNNAK